MTEHEDGRLSDLALGVFPDPVAIVSLAEGKLEARKENVAWSKAFGHLPESPLKNAVVTEAIQKVVSGQTDRVDVTIVAGWAPQDVSVVAMHQGGAALVHARPRPPEKHDRALLFERILHLLPTAIGVMNHAGEAIFVNDATARIIGATREDIEGKGHTELFNPADNALVREVKARVLATGTEEIITMDLSTPIGPRSMFFHFIPIGALSSDKPDDQSVLFIGQDVTEQLRAERDLREQQDFIREVIDTDPNPIFVKDERATFLLVNTACASVFDKTVDEMVGQSDDTIVRDPEMRAMVGESDALVIRTLEEITLEEQIVWHNGDIHWYQTTKRPLVRPNGDVHLLGFSVDITARKETQRKLEEAATEVERRAAEAFRQAEAKAALVEELDQKLAIIDAQHQEILTLSAPLLDVGEDVLAVPIIGAMSEARAEEIMNRLLNAIVERQVLRVVLDLTGLDSIETNTADHLMRIVRAIRLLGAEAIITGIRPAVAQTIVELGIELSDLTTRRTLRQALLVGTKTPKRKR